jgi:hypothetical protein
MPSELATWFHSPKGSQRRAVVPGRLESMPGKHPVIVRPRSGPNPDEEWVHNEPGIDASRVLWAHDMGEGAHRELLTYYRTQKVWLLEADAKPPRLTALA